MKLLVLVCAALIYAADAASLRTRNGTVAEPNKFPFLVMYGAFE